MGTYSVGRLCSIMCVFSLLCAAGCEHPWRPASCEQSWIDPSKTIDAPDQDIVLPIITDVNLLEETQDVFPNAEPPLPGDLEWVARDYILGPGDVLDIRVLDLIAEGVETPMQRIVENTGNITVLQVPLPIRIGGLTVSQARDAIADAYSPDILREPQITVTVTLPRQNIFSIGGAIARPGTYNLPRAEFRLLEAIMLAGDVTQTPLEKIYVYRPTEQARMMGIGTVPPEATTSPTLTPSGPRELTPEGLPPMPGLEQTPPAAAPAAPVQPTGPILPAMPGEETRPVLPATEDLSPQELEALRQALPSPVAQPVTQPVRPSFMHLSQVLMENGPAGLAGDLGAPDFTWVYRDGQWVKVSANAAGPEGRGSVGPRTPMLPEQPAVVPAGPAWQAPTIPRPPGAPAREDPYGWSRADLSRLARVIVIDLVLLRQGDFSQNIIIRDNDVIFVPTLEVGEFYVMGEVNRPGVYSLTGRQVTVRQALTAAGDLGPLSWPSNSVLVRRIGKNQETIQQLNIDLIMAGKEPDIFLKPNDVIAVGTHVAAPFMAVMRNAFRMTYGFGFIYDRNFAEKNLGQFVNFPSFFGL